MKEINYDGNIFLLPKPVKDACCVTTNGDIRRNGKAVMGAGIARYCRDHFTAVDSMLAMKLKSGGNHVHHLGYHTAPGGSEFLLMSFPTKEHWTEDSKPGLIRQSCKEAVRFADDYKLEHIYMPCPGCSNGRLDYWTDVRPILYEGLDSRFVVCIPDRVMEHGEIGNEL